MSLSRISVFWAWLRIRLLRIWDLWAGCSGSGLAGIFWQDNSSILWALSLGTYESESSFGFLSLAQDPIAQDLGSLSRLLRIRVKLWLWKETGFGEVETTKTKRQRLIFKENHLIFFRKDFSTKTQLEYDRVAINQHCLRKRGVGQRPKSSAVLIIN